MQEKVDGGYEDVVYTIAATDAQIKKGAERRKSLAAIDARRLSGLRRSFSGSIPALENESEPSISVGSTPPVTVDARPAEGGGGGWFGAGPRLPSAPALPQADPRRVTIMDDGDVRA